MKKFWKLGLAALVVVVVCGWLAFRWAFPPFVPPALPEPNGYDDLLRAAEMLAPRTGFHDEMDETKLVAVVEYNRPALQLVRKAFNKQCGVPVDWAREPGGLSPAHDRGISAMRNLARALAAQMRVQTSQQQSSAAVGSGLTMLQLGNQCSRGGLIVDSLVSFAVQSTAIEEMRKVIAQDSSVRGEALQGVVPLLDQAEHIDEVIQREVDYVRYALRGIQGMVLRLQLDRLMEPSVEAAREAELRTRAKNRLFVTHLALHSFHDLKGGWPKTVSELSPDILPEVPLDPYARAPFIYREEGSGYRLYSVGKNGKDDGGNGDESGQSSDVTFDLKVPVE